MTSRRAVARSYACAVALAVAVTSLAACTSDHPDRGARHGRSSSPTSGSELPAADVSEELTGGNGVFLASATGGGVDLHAAGWVEQEYVAAGTATSYTAQGALPRDGRFSLRPDKHAAYRTRIVVIRPRRSADFSGTVAVEWLNVSSGVDAAPEFSLAGSELVRDGIAWVGVSAQLIGVEGGGAAGGMGLAGGLAGKGLKKIDPDRYGSLRHPGDAFAYDIFTQVGRALRHSDSSGVLGGLHAQHLLAIGESQSAFALTTYVDGVQPITHAFDGFLLHSRGSTALPLGRPGAAASLGSVIGSEPTLIRTDQNVPVMLVETETDLVSVLGYYRARQPDNAHLRLWEVAGTSHADATQLGPLADSVHCGVPINDGPQRFVLRAALHALAGWVGSVQAPPHAARLKVDATGAFTTIVRDRDGIARGGIRLPEVTVPVATLSGEPGPTGGVICLLLGSTKPFPKARLAELYASRAAYLRAYRRATATSIRRGYALAADRREILADAEPARIAR